MSIQYSGTTIVSTSFTAATKAALQSNVISNLLTSGWSQATGPANGGAQTVTLTLASPGVVNLTAHGLLANDQVVFSTTGALPTGLTAGTVYYVKTVLTTGTFTVSSTSGGTVINFTGSQSGTQTMVGCVRMATAATPWSVTARVRMADNGGNCITFSIENSTSSLVGANSTTGGCFLYPNAGSTTFHMICNAYQAFIFGPAASGNRAFVGFGTPYIPTFLQGVITQCGWINCNAQTDTDTTVRQSFRTTLSGPGGLQPGVSQAICNTSIVDDSGVNFAFTSQAGMPMLITYAGQIAGAVTSQAGFLWHDSSAAMYEPLIAWGNTFTSANGGGSFSSQPYIRGQLWDAVIVNNGFTGDTTTTFAGHNWWAVTDSSVTQQYCTLFVATS